MASFADDSSSDEDNEFWMRDERSSTFYFVAKRASDEVRFFNRWMNLRRNEPALLERFKLCMLATAQGIGTSGRQVPYVLIELFSSSTVEPIVWFVQHQMPDIPLQVLVPGSMQSGAANRLLIMLRSSRNIITVQFCMGNPDSDICTRSIPTLRSSD